MAKSMRTAFVRVTQRNETEKGVVIYTDKDIDEMVKNKAFGDAVEWWYIKHEADEDVSQTHWHIVLRFKKPIPFQNIKRIFPYGSIENAKSIKKCVQYLVHLNDESKKQYSWEEIKTNCLDLTPYKVKSEAQNEITLQSVIDAIERGEIKEYNQFEKIPIALWSKYKSRIENALTYTREKIYMDKNREISVVFISGETGVGKTTFAKHYCEEANKSYCVSSSSNDPMQDYKGQDVLILDDLRDDVFKFADLLKILDNHTKSTTRSRYHNKAFIGDMIIITSSRPLSDWYFDEPRESKEQLYRRIQCQYQMKEDHVDIFTYNGALHKYTKIGVAPNFVKAKPKKQVQIALDMLTAMGLELEPTVQMHVDELMKKDDAFFEAAFDENLPRFED